MNASFTQINANHPFICFISDSSVEMTPGESNFIHPMAVVHPNAVLGQVLLLSFFISFPCADLDLDDIMALFIGRFEQGVSIGPFCTVGASVKIGNASQLQAGCHIMGETEIGDFCLIHT